jgi:hypothetical protein
LRNREDALNRVRRVEREGFTIPEYLSDVITPHEQRDLCWASELPSPLKHLLARVQHTLPAMFSAIYIMQIKWERWLIVSVELSTVLPFIASFDVQ